MSAGRRRVCWFAALLVLVLLLLARGRPVFAAALCAGDGWSAGDPMTNGELFRFEASQSFGQQDDITVLTPTRLAVGKISRTKLISPAPIPA